MKIIIIIGIWNYSFQFSFFFSICFQYMFPSVSRSDYFIEIQFSSIFLFLFRVQNSFSLSEWVYNHSSIAYCCFQHSIAYEWMLFQSSDYNEHYYYYCFRIACLPGFRIACLPHFRFINGIRSDGDNKWVSIMMNGKHKIK